MLPADQSPIQNLVIIWSSSRRPVCQEITACRARLFTAATHEITENAKIGHQYDPLRDFRFQWAAQWLDVADGSRPEIESNVEMLMKFSFQAAPTSRKHLAANDS